MSTFNSDLVLHSQNLETSGDLAYDSGDFQEILTTIATGAKITAGKRKLANRSRPGQEGRRLALTLSVNDAWRPLSEAGAFRPKPRLDGGCPSQKLEHLWIFRGQTNLGRRRSGHVRIEKNVEPRPGFSPEPEDGPEALPKKVPPERRVWMACTRSRAA